MGADELQHARSETIAASRCEAGARPKRVVLFSDPDYEVEDGGMEFRLTYSGPLYASQLADANGPKHRRADHKHDIRKKFHRQLKRLWEITPFLVSGESGGPVLLATNSGYPDHKYTAAYMASKHLYFNHSFVPLVAKEIHLLCSLNILFLRPENPGHVLQSGDLDNRLKTLIDCLTLPTANDGYEKRTLADDEKPLYVLLEDDKLVTKLSVETDQLLELPAIPVSDQTSYVSLVITVNIRPYDLHVGNIQFG